MATRAPYGRRFEDVLKAVYRLQRERGYARVKDIARELNVRASTASQFVAKLERHGYVEHEKYGYVRLTRKGEELVARLYERHLKLKEFLRVLLKLPEDVAERDACYIEHGVHELTMERIRMFLEFVDVHLSRLGYVGFIEKLHHYYEHGTLPDECKRRLGITEEEEEA